MKIEWSLSEEICRSVRLNVIVRQSKVVIFVVLFFCQYYRLDVCIIIDLEIKKDKKLARRPCLCVFYVMT